MEGRDRAAAPAIVAPVVKTLTQPSSSQSRCSGTSFDASVCMEENTEGKLDPERGKLESSSAGTSLEAPGHQCLSNWEMERTTVDGCLLVDGNSHLRETTFSLEDFIIGTQPDSCTSTWFASSKIVCQQMSRKSEDKEPTNEDNKQFDRAGKRWEPPL